MFWQRPGKQIPKKKLPETHAVLMYNVYLGNL